MANDIKIVQSNILIENKAEMDVLSGRIYLDIIVKAQLRCMSIIKRLKETNADKLLTEEQLRNMVLQRFIKESERTFVINLRTFMKDWEITDKGTYEKIKELAINNFPSIGMIAIEKIIDENGRRSLTTRHMIAGAEYIEGSGNLKIIINLDYISHIVAQSSEFTVLRLNSMKKLLKKGTSSARLYELLMQYTSIGKRTFTTEEYRRLMYCEDKHKGSAKLKEKMVNPQVKNINDVSDINVEFESVGRGDNCILNFKIRKKRNEDKEDKVEAIKEEPLFTSESIYNMISQETITLASEIFDENIGEDYIRFVIQNNLLRLPNETLKGISNMDSYIKSIIVKDEKTKKLYIEKKKNEESEIKVSFAKNFKEWLKEIKKDAEVKAAKYKEEECSHLPYYKSCEDALTSLYAARAKACLMGQAEYNGEFMSYDEIKDEIKEYEKSLENIFNNNNIDKRRLEPKYRCPICEDTGIVDDKPCSCLEDRVKEFKAEKGITCDLDINKLYLF